MRRPGIWALLLLYTGFAAAQAKSRPAPGSSLPNAPLPEDRSSKSANGAPEQSNATPQLKQSIEDQSDDQESPAVFRNHLIRDRFWISGQTNVIFQAHGPFHSPYSGDNSFHGNGETAVSRTATLYTAVRLMRFTEIVANVDVSGGKGLSDTAGLGAYVNADAVGPEISQSPYLSRCFIHHTVALNADRIEEEPNPFYLQPSIPRRRLEFTAGKMSLLDFFDVNEVGSDTHLQFTNVAIGNNGVYEYAGDEHGFTVAAMANFQGPKIGIRFAEALLPKISTGVDLDFNVRHVHQENLEFDYSTYTLQGYGTHVRLLSFISHATLGNYSDANNAYLSGQDPTPDITAHRRPGTVKPGFGVNLEQDLPKNFRAYFRGGWNDGRYESFSLTEMNNEVSFGADLSGDAWHRSTDRIGSAFVNSGLSTQHREYLALGGLGFELGDEGLTYGRESASETYYTAHIVGGLYLAAQVSFVNNPGFNRARGPVVVPGLRAHVDF
ncbi:MAG: carbohydrate porin [Acidobacteriaceae bacterium]